MKKVKVLSLFSGIGAFEKALNNIGIDYELVGYVEKCKHASKAYSVIHNVDENLNLGNILYVNEKELPDFDLMTWGFPCTNFSRATRNKIENRNGLNNDESGLYFEGIRILKEKKPSISIIENVPDLLIDKFKEQFEIIMTDLDEAGYTSHYKLLNAYDYNTPQSRERVIIVSIRNDIYNGFNFPNPTPLDIKSSDLLLPIEEISDKFKKINPVIIDKIKTRKLKKPTLCPTLTKAIGKAGSSSEYIANCAFVYQNTGDLRRMTPMETLLFQGFSKEDYFKMKKHTSDTQIFNFSGNTIPVKLLEAVFKELLIDYKYADKINNLKEDDNSKVKEVLLNTESYLCNDNNQLYFDIF